MQHASTLHIVQGAQDVQHMLYDTHESASEQKCSKEGFAVYFLPSLHSQLLAMTAKLQNAYKTSRAELKGQGSLPTMNTTANSRPLDR